MAAFFEFNHPSVDNTKITTEWHIGEKFPKRHDTPCTMVQADGDELFYILTNIDGIPNVKTQRVIIWRGDLAAFIYDNLPLG